MRGKIKLFFLIIFFFTSINKGNCQLFNDKKQIVFFSDNQLKYLVKITKYQEGFVLFWNFYEAKGESKEVNYFNSKFTHIQLDFFDSQANLTKSLKYESNHQMDITPIFYNDIIISNDKIYLMINFIQKGIETTYLYCIKDNNTVYKKSIYPYKFGQFLVSHNNHTVGTCYKEINEPVENSQHDNSLSTSDFRDYYFIKIVNNKWSVDKQKPLKALPFNDAFLNAADHVDMQHDRLVFYSLIGLDFCTIDKLNIYNYQLHELIESSVKTISFGKENQYVKLIKSKEVNEFFMLKGKDMKEANSIKVFITKLVVDKDEITFQNEQFFLELQRDEACSLFNFGFVDILDNDLLIYYINKRFSLYSVGNTKTKEKVFFPIIEFLNKEIKKEGL